MNDILFNSTTDPVPPVRFDIEFIAVENDGRNFIYLHDGMGYATPNIAFERDFVGVFQLFDGKRSITDIIGEMAGSLPAGEVDDGTAGRLLDVARFLDENGMLQSAYFRKRKLDIEESFESADLRMPVCVGTTYPETPDLIRELFDEAFDRVAGKIPAVPRIKALYAPHIDIRVGLDVYARAFTPLRNIRPERVVILATSHYSGLYYPFYENLPYMVSIKDFETPFGSLKCDRQFCEKLASPGDEAGITLRDRSHRLEHSIELHLILLQYLWDHDFSIVPVLVGPLEELMYMNGSHQSGQVEKFTANLRLLLDEETLVLISGDQAHVGKKFGDRVPASGLLEDVRKFDRQFLEEASRGSADGILDRIRSVSDEFRICGFPPLFTWLKTAENARGRVTAYDLWDEHEQESAVSYGSVLYSE